MKKSVYLAVDLGASSGRVMAGVMGKSTLELVEIHRFANGGHRILDNFFWDTVALFAEIKVGLAKAAKEYGPRIVSVGVDTWGVDYGLLDADGHLLGLPHQYRDPRTEGMQERSFRRVSRRRIYDVTGIQFMSFNTIYQLVSEAARRSPALANANRLLFTPDLLNFWLSGVQANEYTIASTSQLLDARTRGWSKDLLRKLGLPVRAFGPVVQPGTLLGGVLPSVREETGLGAAKVVAVGSHDTASAVAAVPTQEKDFAYLSSGTWSLMGVERTEPVINATSYAYGFTNEGGVCGTIRLLKNISGLWLIQESRRTWKQQGLALEFEDVRSEAAKAPPFLSLIDPDHPDFATPGDMPARIAAFCKRSKQKVPRAPGEVARVIYESLALRYRDVFDKLQRLTGRTYDTLHVVGGGSRDLMLNQMTADALQRTVLAGPVEATALGNVMLQLLANRSIRTLQQGRDLIRQSFPLTTFKPRKVDGWEAAADRFASLTRRPSTAAGSS